MKLGIVIGVVWATKKVREINGCRMYIVQPISANEIKTESPHVVADPENMAAAGDRVIYVTNSDAAEAFCSGFAPVNASIVQLVDGIA
jgi:microcompartment protein CcmK/EutM